MHGATMKISGIALFMRKTKQLNHLSYTSFTIVPFCNYTILPTTVKVMETFLKANLCKPFQLFRRIPSDVTSTTQTPSLQCWFELRKQVRIILNQIRKVRGMFQCCQSFFFFLRNPWPNPTGVLKHYREEKTVCFPFFGTFDSDRIPKAKKGVSLPFSLAVLYHAANPVNYTCEFREILEAAPYISDGSCLE